MFHDLQGWQNHMAGPSTGRHRPAIEVVRAVPQAQKDPRLLYDASQGRIELFLQLLYLSSCISSAVTLEALLLFLLRCATGAESSCALLHLQSKLLIYPFLLPF